MRAVRADGSDLDGRHAVIRVLALPLSFLLFGFGFLLILLRRDRRALHDLIARTRRRLRVGRPRRPAAVPRQALDGLYGRPPTPGSLAAPCPPAWYRASMACSSARRGNRSETIAAPIRMAMIPAT